MCPTTETWLARRASSFGSLAADYELYRPTYPEPAPEMAELLRSRLDDAGVGGRVIVRVGTFESLAQDCGRFGLVVAAQSFHWTDPDTRWKRLVNVLVPGGAAATFWTRAEIIETDGLEGLVESSYPWTWELSGQDYLALLATTSQYALLAEDARRRLFDSLQTELGDHVTLQGATLLSRMRRRLHASRCPNPS